MFCSVKLLPAFGGANVMLWIEPVLSLLQPMEESIAHEATTMKMRVRCFMGSSKYVITIRNKYSQLSAAPPVFC
jgi:hypothetical protein